MSVIFIFICSVICFPPAFQRESYEKIPDIVIESIEEYVKSEDNHKIVFFLLRAISENKAKPFIDHLTKVASSPDDFRGVADEMVRDINKLEGDPQYEQFMQDIWSKFVNSKDTSDLHLRESKTERSIRKSGQTAAHYSSVLSVIQMMPQQNFDAMVGLIANFKKFGATSLAESLASARGTGKVHVALIATALAPEIIHNFRQWWYGRIDAAEVGKRMAVLGGTTAAGVAGGYFGQFAGGQVGFVLGGPAGATIGMFLGALVGSDVASRIANKFVNKLMNEFFSMPRALVVKNAYKFLGVGYDASDNEINKAYRLLAKLYHPDKHMDGSEAHLETVTEKWLELQYNMEVIRMHRSGEEE